MRFGMRGCENIDNPVDQQSGESGTSIWMVPLSLSTCSAAGAWTFPLFRPIFTPS